MRIIVTGGAGFIGSHLCEYLMKNGDEIICIDNLFTGTRRNIRHLLSNPRFTFLRHDITEKLDLGAMKIDQIYNLACPASPIHYQKDPVETIRANTDGVVHMLELAKRHGARILQTSTSEVYGDPTEHPQKETYWGNVNPIGPRSCYDEGKRFAESLFFAYHHQYHLDIRLARIFNTYGPRMTPEDGRVISNFTIQALQNQPITIYGSGEQTRSLCYITDMVQALKLLMNQTKTIGPINLGNPRELTIRQIAEKIIQLTKSSSKIIYQSLPTDDPKKRQPDITLAKTHLNWQPKVQIEIGLPKTIDYFRKLLS